MCAWGCLKTGVCMCVTVVLRKTLVYRNMSCAFVCGQNTVVYYKSMRCACCVYFTVMVGWCIMSSITELNCAVGPRRCRPRAHFSHLLCIAFAENACHG